MAFGLVKRSLGLFRQGSWSEELATSHSNFIWLSDYFLPVSFAIVIVAYIFIGADGLSWADKPLEVVFYLSIALNIACYLSALLHHSKHYFTASAILSAMIFLIYVGALFASIPGTGDRYGNRGIDISAYIGLVCGALIFIQN